MQTAFSFFKDKKKEGKSQGRKNKTKKGIGLFIVMFSLHSDLLGSSLGRKTEVAVQVNYVSHLVKSLVMHLL